MKRLLLLLLVCGCDQRTSVLVTINGVPAVTALDFDVQVVGRGLHHTTLVADGAPAMTLPMTVTVLLPDSAVTVELSLSGKDDAGRHVEQHTSFESSPHRQLKLTMTLGAPGADMAMPGDFAGVDQANFGATDLASSDLAGSSSGDGGTDMSPPPSLLVLAGFPGANNISFDGVGRDARFNVPQQPVLVGTSLYFFDRYSASFRKVDVTNGNVTTVPLTDDSNSLPFSGEMVGLVYASSANGGTFYASDSGGNSIRKITLSDARVRLVAGDAVPDSTDSPPRFFHPYGLALDGNADLWVADSGNGTIRKIVLAGPVVTTPAGDPAAMREILDGSGSGAHFYSPLGLCFNGPDLYVSDENTLRLVHPSPTPAPVSTLLPPGSWTDDPIGVVAAPGGTLYVADYPKSSIRRVTLSPSPVGSLVAGLDEYVSFSIDGVGTAAGFTVPMWLVLDGAGAAYITEAGAVRKMTLSDFTVTTLAGMSPQVGNNDSPDAHFSAPAGVMYHAEDDTVWVADAFNNLVRSVNVSTGETVTLFGDGTMHSKDGQGTAAELGTPTSLARDANGFVYVSDGSTHTIRQISSTGFVKTIAGADNVSGLPSPSPVPGSAARFNNPFGLAFDGTHTLYVADSANNVIRAIDLGDVNYTVTTVAGSGAPGGDNGTGVAATFDDPRGLAWNAASHTLYVADANTALIRTIDLANPAMPNVGWLAGGLYLSSYHDGSFSAAAFDTPTGLAFDSARGILWVTDMSNHVVRRLDLASQMVTTPIGTPHALFTKPGPLPADVHSPLGVALTPRGLVITSFDENTVLIATGL